MNIDPSKILQNVAALVGLSAGGLVVAALIIICWAKIFRKAGEKGWKAVVPVYNVFTWFKVAENGKLFWPFFLVCILDAVCITVQNTQKAFLDTYHYNAMFKILVVFFTAILVVLFVAQTFQLAKAFGKGVGFFFGLLLLPVVFYPILAFGSSTYASNNEVVRPEKRHTGLKASRIISNTVIYIILIAMSIIWIIPFVFILLQSFRVESTWEVGYVIPHEWGFDNYVNLFTGTDFPRWYLNTFIMALVVAVLQTVIVLCMSYTLSRFRFKMRKPLMRFMLILGMFPGMLTMIILYRVLKDLGLTQANAVPGLILVYVASSGMGYYVSKGFFDTLPKSLDEAARVDGATRAQVLTKIILPLSKPIVIYTILTAFMGPWGDFVFARYISFGTSAGQNVAVGLFNFLNQDQIGSKYTMFCAGGVVVAIPVTILFLFLQKYYVEGVTGGAVKG